jgi:hypothetical protein
MWSWFDFNLRAAKVQPAPRGNRGGGAAQERAAVHEPFSAEDVHLAVLSIIRHFKPVVEPFL